MPRRSSSLLLPEVPGDSWRQSDPRQRQSFDISSLDMSPLKGFGTLQIESESSRPTTRTGLWFASTWLKSLSRCRLSASASSLMRTKTAYKLVNPGPHHTCTSLPRPQVRRQIMLCRRFRQRPSRYLDGPSLSKVQKLLCGSLHRGEQGAEKSTEGARACCLRRNMRI